MGDGHDRLRAALADRYAILGELGAGGMATVYLAEDLKHHRKVAVKVLRPELAAILGGERFLKEIEVTANLQHPHILPLYDSGKADTFLFFVTPFIEGESLRDKLDRERQLSIEETVDIGRAIASALEYAHERNVIHRDIKPANILLQSGHALVADFGIALAVSEAGGQRLTETGLSLGTPHYMSPEQASGDRELDRRSDVYSLAATLYEAFAGEPPFAAPSTPAIVAKILTERPPLVSDVRETVPSHTARAVQKALEKLPADRFQTAAAFADALTNPGAMTTGISATFPRAGAPVRAKHWRATVPWFAAVAALAVAAAAILFRGPSATGVANAVEFVVRFDDGINHGFALSEDGRQLVVSGENGGLLTRAMDAARITSLTATDGPIRGQPVFSPDGEWIAYIDVEERELQRIPARGGVPVIIAEVPLLVMGLAWGPQDTLVWGRGFSGLWAVPVEGGTPVQLTVPDTARGELGHWHPQFLPGGTRLLFSTYRAPFDSTAVELLDLETRERTVLFRGGARARYASSGHIVYAQGETLWAVPFDLNRFRVSGPRFVAREGVSYDPTNARSGFEIAADGTLAYMPASVWNSEAELTWVDRAGSTQILSQEPGVFAEPAISPDGNYLAVVRTLRGEPDLWVYDLVRGGEPIRVTRGDGLVANPVWAPDSRELIYSRERRLFELVRRDWQTGAPEVPISIAPGLIDGTDLYAYAVTPDGRLLIGTQGESWDIWTAHLGGTGAAREYRVTEYHERDPVLSPDGRWVAYTSNESGPLQVWLHPYPAGDRNRGRRLVTRSGGEGPQWGTGGELFFRSDDKLLGVRIDLATGTPQVPVELFAGPYMSGANYAVHPTGERFLMIKPRTDAAFRREIVVVVNWIAELQTDNGRE